MGREFFGGGGLRISLQDEGIFSLLFVCLFLVKGLEVGEEEEIIQDCFDKLMLITRPVLYLSYIVRGTQGIGWNHVHVQDIQLQVQKPPQERD